MDDGQGKRGEIVVTPLVDAVNTPSLVLLLMSSKNRAMYDAGASSEGLSQIDGWIVLGRSA